MIRRQFCSKTHTNVTALLQAYFFMKKQACLLNAHFQTKNKALVICFNPYIHTALLTFPFIPPPDLRYSFTPVNNPDRTYYRPRLKKNLTLLLIPSGKKTHNSLSSCLQIPKPR